MHKNREINIRAVTDEIMQILDIEMISEESKKRVLELLNMKDYIGMLVAENSWINASIIELLKTNVGYSRWDLAGKPLEWNSKMVEMLGFSLKYLLEYHKEHGEVQTLMYKDEIKREEAKNFIENYLKKGLSYSEIFFPDSIDSKNKALLYYSGPTKDSSGNFNGSVRFAFDVTESIENKNQNEFLNEIIKNSISAIVAYDSDGNLIRWNRKMEEITGYSFNEVKDLNGDEIMRLLYKGDEYERVMNYLNELELTGRGYTNVPFTLTRKDGSKRIVLWNTIPFKGGTIRSGQDITELHYAKGMLLKDPSFDCLNRIGLLDGLTNLMTEKRGSEKREGDEEMKHSNNHSIIFGDIDDFKVFNDIYGHQVGDLVIEELISYLRLRLRESDIISRFGGDEFIIIMKGANEQDAINKINKIRTEFRKISFKAENGKITEKTVHASEKEASDHIKRNNDSLKGSGISISNGTAYFGTIGSSWGAVEIVYDTQDRKFEEYKDLLKDQTNTRNESFGITYDDEYKEAKKNEAKIILDYKKRKADRLLLAVKYAKSSDISLDSKNGVGSFMRDKDGNITGVRILHGDGNEVIMTLDELITLENRKNEEKIKR
ncbi:MAG: diguanylate cyclase [Candidatus Gracilibacteria bacterium]|nr:diguanylate cyclase [Candidatus Gracilibacteria bacterium]